MKVFFYVYFHIFKSCVVPQVQKVCRCRPRAHTPRKHESRFLFVSDDSEPVAMFFVCVVHVCVHPTAVFLALAVVTKAVIVILIECVCSSRGLFSTILSVANFQNGFIFAN